MKKILVIRFSSIGDIVLTTPVIRSLKKQLACELHVLTKQKFSSIYANNPYVGKVHMMQSSEREIIPQLKKEEFDFVVDLQKNMRSYRVKRALGRPAASFPKLNLQKWLLVNFKINHLPHLHVVDRYFEAVKDLNVLNDGKGLDYFIPDHAVVDLSSVHPVLASGYVAIAIGGQHETKIMPAEKMAAIIKKIEMPVMLLGDQSDRERGKLILQYVDRQDVLNTCGLYSLDQSASLIQQATAIISHDTGLMHIAAALHKPILSIWGNTVPDFGMYPYMPGNTEMSVINEVNGLTCRPCSKLGYKKCPKKHFRCMVDQDESQITESLSRLVEQNAKKNLSR